jgi:small subunit ribosomal protein S8
MDVIANFLNSIKTAGFVSKESVILPHSKLKESIALVLKREGYIKTYSVHEDGVKKTLEVVLAYKGKTPRITGLQRMSRPSNRVYKGVSQIFPVKYGHGIAVLSTPKGIMTDKEARKEMVGGELLFTIW